MKKGVIYLIPSSIAEGAGPQNLTPQLAGILPGIKHFIAEHAREARRFISSLKLGIKIEDLKFTELNKHSDLNEIGNMLDPALNGKNMGLMSDAGCPGVADPGAEVVKLAHQKNIRVIPLVGPSSILLALMASGLSGQNFRFSGYLPIDQKSLKGKIGELENQSRKHNETQIFIETPYRSDKILNLLINTLQPSTLLTLAKDITGADEKIITMTVSKWKNQTYKIGKSPCVFLFLAQ
ncbi:MAG: SAM-dependent methyltransferase [Bacteroidota bacterium]